MLKRSQNTQWRANVAKAARKNAKDPVWQAANKAGAKIAAKTRSQSSAWKKAILAANKKLPDDPDWLANNAAARPGAARRGWARGKKPGCCLYPRQVRRKSLLGFAAGAGSARL